VPTSRRSLVLAVALFAALVAILVRLAWVSDDAYITLRTVEHWLDGHGLRWNVAERAQTYTHPLWLLVLTAGRALTGEAFFTTIALGLLFSLLATALLVRLGRTAPAAVAILACLATSRSFGDFATSGLENPLTFALLAAFALALAGEGSPQRRLGAAALLTGLAATTRLDLVVLCGPALLGAALAAGPRPATAARLLLGLSPLLAWLAFATAYYGTPWPVTAYAKAIAVGIDPRELIVQGLRYLWYVTTRDPVTMAVIAAGCAVGLGWARLRARLLALGVLLYLAYVVKVGGDFMGGRFATPPFVAALAILARAGAALQLPLRTGAAIAAGALALSFAAGVPPYLRSLQHDEDGSSRTEYHGISDERLLYYRLQGLWSSRREIPVAGITSDRVLREALGRTRPLVLPCGVVGRFGYLAGDLVHVCDPWLCDPLLMRLPAHAESMRRPDREDPWHIGHFARRIPEGYLESLATAGNQLHHPGLRRYYEALRTVLRAPVWDGERLAALWQLLRGELDADLRAFVATDYLHPPRLRAELLALSPPLPAGTYWCDEPRTRVVYAGGLAIALAGDTTASALQLMLHPGTTYRITLRRRGAAVAELVVDAEAIPQAGGLQPFEVAVPAGAGAVDEVWLDGTTDATRVAAIGGLTLVR
jgi:arabinofuranosyltransferase